MDYLLTFQNTHYAIHSEKSLLEQQISVSVMPLPTSLGSFCGICLRLEEKDFSKGRNQLIKEKIPIKEIFVIEENNEGRNYLPWKS